MRSSSWASPIPANDIRSVIIGALLLGFAGATFDIVIDAYRIETLEPSQLGVGSGMSQYGWRLGAFFAASIALFVAARSNWTMGYLACAPLALIGPIASVFMGEPKRHRDPKPVKGARALLEAFWGPLADFLKREGALLVLLFVLVHKIGDTMANLMIRDLLVGLGFTKDEILYGDVWVGFFALLAGIFVGGVLYAKLGMKRSVLVSLVLMAISNLSFAALAAAGHSMPMLAFAIGFENFASGIGGVVVVAYLSALCNLRYTASQFALLSAAAAIVGRFLTGTTAGSLIDAMGYVNFYLLTTALALPGVLLYTYMLRAGLIDESIGNAGREGAGDVVDDPPRKERLAGQLAIGRERGPGEVERPGDQPRGRQLLERLAEARRGATRRSAARARPGRDSHGRGRARRSATERAASTARRSRRHPCWRGFRGPGASARRRLDTRRARPRHRHCARRRSRFPWPRRAGRRRAAAAAPATPPASTRRRNRRVRWRKRPARRASARRGWRCASGGRREAPGAARRRASSRALRAAAAHRLQPRRR